MKYIRKDDEPESFIKWKNLSKENWEPTYGNLSKTVRKDIKNALMNEQGFICCYCEAKLEYHDSHIEHLCPQSKDEERRLDFSNMLCSCQQKIEKGEPLHCGNSKGNSIIPITPLMKHCENKFTYTSDGQIESTDDASKQTIKALSLDIDKLNILRSNAIEPFIIDPIEEISDEDAKKFADSYLKKQDDGQYNEFYTTIKYLFG